MEACSVLLSILFILLSIVAYKYYEHRNYFKKLGIAHDTPQGLLTGNMGGLFTKYSFADIWTACYYKFKGTGPFAGFYNFYSPSALILDIDLVKRILIKDFAKFTDRGLYHNVKDDPLTGTLFLIDGQKWRNLRNKLSPTFTSGKMKFMFPTVLQVGEVFAKVMGELITQESIVEVKELLARFTTDVIGTCAFGIECNSLKDPEAEFRVMGRRAVTDQRHGRLGFSFLFGFPNLARWLGMKQTPDHIEAFFMRIVREVVEYREKNNIRRNDFLDMLIELKNNKIMKSEDGQILTNLTMEEVAAQTFVFFAAGFETSSTAMGFALYELAQHQDIQQRVREEIQRVLAKHNQEFTYECMKELEYLDQVISETLRMYTVVPVLNRQALVDYPVPGYPDYVIKKGMPVIIPSEGIHRDPEYYPDPDVFDPDRFSPDKVKERDSILWLPFGEGPRNCIGMRFGMMQTRIGLALLLKNFRFSICEKTTIPMVYNVEAFLRSSKDGIYLKVEKL